MITCRRPTIFSIKEGNTNDDYVAVTAMLRSQMIQYDEIIDQKLAMEWGRGRLNPLGPGFVVLLPGAQRVFNAVDLAMWIDRQGLKLLS